MKKILDAVLSGSSDANIAYRDLCRLLLRLGFEERSRGSHHVFRRAGIPEHVNLQESGGKAKAYQVKQVRRVIVRHRLAGEL